MSIPQPPPATKHAPGITTTDRAPRCWHCGRRLADYLTRPWALQCRKCKSVNASPPLPAMRLSE